MNYLRRWSIDLRYLLFKCFYSFPKIHSNWDTLDKLLSTDCSMCRFGDGEFHMINQTENLGFQTVDNALSARLKEVLSADLENCLICVPYGLRSIRMLKPRGTFFWKQFVVFHYREYIKYFNFSKEYYDACVTRPYIDWLDNRRSAEFFEKMKGLWANKNILIVEGDMSRLGMGNDLFAQAKTVRRIVTFSQNAFSVYTKLLERTREIGQDYDLVLIALGPTATVLAYDLAKLGIRALDIGHIDIEYEWFLRKATDKIPILGKHVNEAITPAVEHTKGEEQYESQIISRIFTC